MLTCSFRAAVGVLACTGIAILLASPPAAGQTIGPAADAAAPAPSGAAPAPRRQEEPGLRVVMKRHPTVQFGSVGELSLRARLESRVRTATPVAGLHATDARWQSQRIEIQGTLLDRVGFALSHEFTDADEPERDAYVTLRVARALEIQAGRAKLPFGRDAQTGRTSLDFITRSLVGSQLAPGRDAGVSANGRLFGRVVSYEAGFFRRDGDNARTAATAGGRDALAARVRIAPFAARKESPFAALEIGAAATRSRLDDQLGLRGRTVFGEGVFFDRVFVNGTRVRRGLEAGWALGPVSASGEYISVSDERTGMGPSGEALPDVRTSGWYLAGTWTVTGEQKHGRIVPRGDFLRGGIGALELAARVERFAFDAVSYPGTPFGFPSGASLGANADRVTTLGVTWYVNRFVKAQANLVMEAVDDPQRSPAAGSDGRFTSGVFLFQLAL